MFNVWQFFPGYSVSLFDKISCTHPLLSRYCVYFKTALAVRTCVYTMYLADISLTLNEQIESYIWVVPPLFQESTCRDLAFLKLLSFFEISTCNRLCFQRYRVNMPPVAAIQSTIDPFSIIKVQLQPQILSNLLYFFCTQGVVARKYHS